MMIGSLNLYKMKRIESTYLSRAWTRP